MEERQRNTTPGFHRWETRIRTTHKQWLDRRVRTHGAARPGYGIVDALDEALKLAKEALSATEVPDAATTKQAKRATPVARKVNQPGKIKSQWQSKRRQARLSR